MLQFAMIRHHRVVDNCMSVTSVPRPPAYDPVHVYETPGENAHCHPGLSDGAPTSWYTVVQSMVKPLQLQSEDRRTSVVTLMRDAQRQLCQRFEQLESQGMAGDAHRTQHRAHFDSASWERSGGGGGTARVLTNGRVFERAGVNVSAISGDQVPPSIWQERPRLQGQSFFVTGISLVLHPRNPYVPAFHANFRYFEVGQEWWFGGGMDMTPCYGFVEDAQHFHRTLKEYCDRHPIVDYETLKQTCDQYFYIKHRREMRGIGGIFFDMLQPEGGMGWEQAIAFVQDGISTLQRAYLPIVQRRMAMPYAERERTWQLYRRGRYVEFNLVYDRGTVFGLQTGGDSEAILMSLPPLARWEFRYHPEPGSAEAELADFLQPRNWADT